MTSSPFGIYPIVEKINSAINNSVNVRLCSLKYVDVLINGLKCKALCDSGAQLPIISRAVCDQIKAEACVHIKIQGVVGDPISALLVNVDIKLCGEPDSVNIADGNQVLCGVASLTLTEYDVILASATQANSAWPSLRG